MIETTYICDLCKKRTKHPLFDLEAGSVLFEIESNKKPESNYDCDNSEYIHEMCDECTEEATKAIKACIKKIRKRNLPKKAQNDKAD